MLGEGGGFLLPSSPPLFIFSFPIFLGGWGGGVECGGGRREDMCVFSLTMGASPKCSLHSCPAGELVTLPGPHFEHSIPAPRLGFPGAPRH